MKASDWPLRRSRRVLSRLAGARFGGSPEARIQDSPVVLSHNGVNIPPARLRNLVRKGAISAEGFIQEGADVYGQMDKMLSENGLSTGGFNRVLEFGVGCSRVARHLLSQHEIDFVGIDVDPELIDWSWRNIASSEAIGGRTAFAQNSYLPPTTFQSATFDFVYSISVFTHLRPNDQVPWFRELERVLVPGGHLLISIIEARPEDLPDGAVSAQRNDRAMVRGWLGASDAPSEYVTTRNTIEYCSRTLPEETELVGSSPRVIRGKQSLLLFRKSD